MKGALRNTENRNSLALGLLATGALLEIMLKIVSESTLRIPVLVLLAIVFTAAVWSAPRGRRAQGLSRRYRGTMSRTYRWPLITMGLAGCALYSVGLFGVAGTDSRILVAILGFVCLQAVAIALLFPLGRTRRIYPA